MRAASIILLLLMLASCDNTDEIPTYSEPTVCFHDSCFKVEIADSSAERTIGLMHREYLAPDRGMLFMFDESGTHRFWMKNTLIPLDIIWISENQSVIYVSSDTPPCKTDPCTSYGPAAKAKYVLELNSGLASENRITEGTQVRIKLSG